MFNNLKTTLAGCIPGVIFFLYGFVQGLQAGQPFDFKSMGLGVTLAVLGSLAKDFNSTGGTNGQTPEAVVRVEKQEVADAKAAAGK